MSPDPYDVLGVPREAQAEDLKAAYRRLVRENHPDVASDKVAATARMASINHAWQLVGDPQKRLAFDARMRLEAFERQNQPRAAPRPDGIATPTQAPRDSSEASLAEARLAAQRRARLERERLEREHARHLRTSTGKSPKTAAAKAAAKAASPNSNSQKPASASQGTASKKLSRERSLNASRDARLRQKLTQAAQLFHRERKVEEAVALCRSVLLADGRSVAARELLGDIYLQQGRAEYALMMFDQALLLAPENLMLRRKRDQLQSAQDKPKRSSHQAKAPHTSLLGRLRRRWSRQG